MVVVVLVGHGAQAPFQRRAGTVNHRQGEFRRPRGIEADYVVSCLFPVALSSEWHGVSHGAGMRRGLLLLLLLRACLTPSLGHGVERQKNVFVGFNWVQAYGRGSAVPLCPCGAEYAAVASPVVTMPLCFYLPEAVSQRFVD